jgi:phospholipid/cholesterol/gamma-HCH transport system substrate-binding protein
MKHPLNPFKLGLFVLVGLALGLGILIWIGATTLFQPTRTYASFFDYSIAGLQRGAPVQRLGVKVGQVADLRLVGDGQWVLVLVKIEKNLEPADTMYLQPSRQGLTGQDYLALKSAPAPLPRPGIPVKVAYPVLPNRPGELARIMEQARKVAARLAELDIAKLVEDVRRTVTGAESLMNDPDLRQAIADLRDASADARGILEGLSGSGKAKDWRATQQNFAAAIAALRKTSEKLARMAEGVPPEAVGKIVTDVRDMVGTGEQAIGSWDRQAEQDLILLEDTLEQANRLLNETERLVRSLRREPGRILERRQSAEPFTR